MQRWPKWQKCWTRPIVKTLRRSRISKEVGSQCGTKKRTTCTSLSSGTFKSAGQPRRNHRRGWGRIIPRSQSLQSLWNDSTLERRSRTWWQSKARSGTSTTSIWAKLQSMQMRNRLKRSNLKKRVLSRPKKLRQKKSRRLNRRRKSPWWSSNAPQSLQVRRLITPKEQTL